MTQPSTPWWAATGTPLRRLLTHASSTLQGDQKFEQLQAILSEISYEVGNSGTGYDYGEKAQEALRKAAAAYPEFRPQLEAMKVADANRDMVRARARGMGCVSACALH